MGCHICLHVAANMLSNELYAAVLDQFHEILSPNFPRVAAIIVILCLAIVVNL